MNRIASIKLGGNIEYTKVKPKDNPHADSGPIPKRKNAMNWGNKIHLNGTPTDTTGHRMEGADDANFEATYDRAWDQIEKFNDGYIFTKWSWDGEPMGGPIDLGSVADNFGCTPTLKPRKQDEDEGRHKLVIYQVYAEGTPFEVRSNELEVEVD